MKSKYTTLLGIVFVVILVDQWTKSMAVDYLRRPERFDFYEPCRTQRKNCEARCTHRASTHGNLSLVACQKRCNLQEQVCQHKYARDYEWALVGWKQRQKEMQQSLMCRRVEYTGSSRPECVVVPKYFHFTYRINRGAAWGIFSDLPQHIRRPFFVSITLVAILFIMFLFMFRLETEHRIMVIALSLILGGALGNFLDRVRLDYVIDFIEWFWRDRRYTWPTFNIADTAISCGVVLIAIELFFFAPSEYEENAQTPGERPPDETPAPGERPLDEAPTQSERPLDEASTPDKRPLDEAPAQSERPLDEAPTRSEVPTGETLAQDEASSREAPAEKRDPQGGTSDADGEKEVEKPTPPKSDT